MTVVVVTHAAGKHKSIVSTEEPLLQILVDPDRETAKIERYPFYMYFDSLEQAQRLRDMLNALLELNPTIKPNVPSESRSVTDKTLRRP